MTGSQPSQTFTMEQTALLTNNFNVWLDGALFAKFDGIKMKWGGVFDVEGRKLKVVSDSAFKTVAHIEAEDGTTVANGAGEGLFKWAFKMQCGGGAFQVKSGRGDLAYVAFQGDAPTGNMQGRANGNSSGTCVVASATPIEIKLLIFWLMARKWRSANDGQVSGRD